MNNDKKLEEYLKALGEGKTIAVIWLRIYC
jgi:hypothetical protein